MRNKKIGPKIEDITIDHHPCIEANKIFEDHIKVGKPPEKFPEPCNHCWKVLVFDVNENEADYIRNKFKSYISKTVPMKNEKGEIIPQKFLVVIYTYSIEERDEVRNKVECDKKIKARVRYRFACKAFQEYFPEMFISAGKPNPSFL